MFKVLCLLAIVAAVSAGINQPAYPSAPQAAPRIVKREATMEPEQPAKEAAGLEAQDDMDKAETFGFGYHKVVHVYPSYYPSYPYGYGYGYGHGYGYPGFYGGYHHGYYY